MIIIIKNDLIFCSLKPENVLIDKDGYCKISDFGLSTFISENFNEANDPAKERKITPI
jgi:serine/threonine protein kinase